MLQNIGTLEIIIIAVVILLLFGASRLPIFARGVVDAKKEFKKGFKDDDKDSEKSEK